MSSTPLELIDIDVWGPSLVILLDGYHYYVLFIDDFSRFTWIYPIIQKYDTFTIFHQFQSYAEKFLWYTTKNIAI